MNVFNNINTKKKRMTCAVGLIIFSLLPNINYLKTFRSQRHQSLKQINKQSLKRKNQNQLMLNYQLEISRLVIINKQFCLKM